MSQSIAPRVRLDVLWIFLYASCAIIALRLFDLQLLRHEALLKAAERNRTQLIFTTSPRGRIFDRNGRLLAGNRATFSLVYLPPKTEETEELERLARTLASTLKQTPNEIMGILQRALKRGAPVRLAQGIPWQAMFQLSELKTLVRGMNLVVEAERTYPYGALGSHLLGYLGNMETKYLGLLREAEGYRMDSMIGKAGIERLFERDLHGIDGGILLEVDAGGHLKRVLDRIPFRPGRDITLTLDAQVQEAAENALRRSVSGKGAVVAMDPYTGEILALASQPGFDPNWFVELPTEKGPRTRHQIPEFNLAVQGTYPPGSILKIVTAAALFNEGRARPGDRVHCPGYFKLGDRTFKCWRKEGHGDVAFLDAMRDSCDVYFYQMGLKTGGATLERYSRWFGVGEPTHVPLPGEATGNAFGPMARLGKRPRWRKGDTVNLSIGQGGILVTPIQMAALIGTVATRGTMFRPQFISRISEPDGETIFQTKPEVLRQVDIKPEIWDLLQKSLERVVEDGTGKKCRVPGLVVAGKTGTAQNPRGEDHAWFVAYAGRPGEPPRVALVVLIQHGGHGGETAGPVAKEILEAVFKDRAPTGEAVGRL